MAGWQHDKVGKIEEEARMANNKKHERMEGWMRKLWTRQTNKR